MKNVERIYLGHQWAEPEEGSHDLQVKLTGSDLKVTGLLPRYQHPNEPTDLIWQYQRTIRYAVVGPERMGKDSPVILFANADTDQKLIAFVRRFGPVTAKVVYNNFEVPEKGLPEPRLPARLSAVQDLQELMNEQSIYRSMLDLIIQLYKKSVNYQLVRSLIEEIAAKIPDWRRQWKREKMGRKRN